ncbi:MAG: hypothetical protein R2710_05385 [Acidimicrobiales bacterium]
MTTTFDALSPAERGVLQRRTLFSLVGGVLPGGGALTAAVAANALLGEEITGRASLGTLAAAFLTIGGTLATTPLASYTSRHGRRRGLRLGWAIGFLGAISVPRCGVRPLPVPVDRHTGDGRRSGRQPLGSLCRCRSRRRNEPAKQIGKLVWTSSFSSALGPTIALGAMSAVRRVAGTQ